LDDWTWPGIRKQIGEAQQIGLGNSSGSNKAWRDFVLLDAHSKMPGRLLDIGNKAEQDYQVSQ
jgi:hypothetical protein